MTDRPIDPLGRRALFGDPPVSDPEAAAGPGRRALFSAAPSPAPEPEPPAPAGGRRAPGRLAVDCSACLQRTPVGLVALGRQLIPSLWWPLRHYSLLMRCPSCHRLAWCRVDVGGLLRP